MSNLKHFDHVFMPVGDGVYLVKCTRTGGEFSSIMLINGNQRCPCCQQIVEKHRK
jgi:hypothetical protein